MLEFGQLPIPLKENAMPNNTEPNFNSPQTVTFEANYPCMESFTKKDGDQVVSYSLIEKVDTGREVGSRTVFRYTFERTTDKSNAE